MIFIKVSAIILISCMLIFNSACVIADDDISQLKTAIAELQKANLALEKSRTDEAKMRFKEVKGVIFRSVQDSKQLQTKYEETVRANALAGLLVELGDATNPSSDALGVKFKDVVMDSAKKSFIKIQEHPSSWQRFSKIVGKLMDNPIVGSAINSNAISSMVGSIIQTAAGYSETRVITGPVRSETVDFIETAELKAFTASIAPYTNFYDKVSEAASNYQFEKNALDKKNSAIAVSIFNYSKSLISNLQLKPESSDGAYTDQLGSIFSKISDVSNFAEIEQVLSDPRVKSGYVEASKYPHLEFSVDQFRDEYSTALNAYLYAYNAALKNLIAIKDSRFDDVKLKRLSAKIETHQEAYSSLLSSSAAKQLEKSQLLIKLKNNQFYKFDAFKHQR